MRLQRHLHLCMVLLLFGVGPAMAQTPQPTVSDWDTWLSLGAERSQYLKGHSSTESARLTSQQDRFENQIAPLLQEACLDCHGPDTQEGHFRIDQLNPDLVNGSDVDWWLEVQAVLAKAEMPPPGEGDLSDSDRGQILQWVSQEIQFASQQRRQNSGQSSFRRMTRYEFNYALQDLLGKPWEFARDLPPEAHSADGFQNSSDVLHLSGTQLESYHHLARKALQRVTVEGEQPKALHWSITMNQAGRVDWGKQDVAIAEARKAQTVSSDDPTAWSQFLETYRQTPAATYYYRKDDQRKVPATWEYYGAQYANLPVDTLPEDLQGWDQWAVIPSGGRHKLTIELGDQLPDQGILRVKVLAAKSSDTPTAPLMRLEFGWQASNEGRALLPASDIEHVVTATVDSPQYYQWDIPLGEIYPRNSVRGISTMGQMPSPSEYLRIVNSSLAADSLNVYHVQVSSPVYDQWPPQSHRNLLCDSNHQALPPTEVLQRWMVHAWRRPVSEAQLEAKLHRFQQLREHCDTEQQALLECMATILASPNFLYLNQPLASAENDSPASENAAELSDARAFQLASRLSFFLWCSIPDEELLSLAASGQLLDSSTLQSQIQRMLSDPRSRRFSRHFVQQWLDLTLLEHYSHSELDSALKQDMQEEPVQLFQHLLENNRSILELVHADYVMINQRLALHYGLPDVVGNHFRKVPIAADGRRGGMLTLSGILAMNSDGTDSHPLKRGVWILESLLNDPPPPPPPAVPQIDLADPRIAEMTLKQRIEDHRNHDACRSCHSRIDPWGIAFENYDALGRWRDQIKGQPVDATSQLFNQQTIEGVVGLKQYVLENRQDQVVRAMIHKLAVYALGRPLTFADHAEIDRIATSVRQQGDGLGTAIQRLVTSPLFQAP